ncbi:TPA: SIR2 family protein [Burkholderia cenocepacia]|uniref:SIR2 family protein n=1 Tax=Burkholderia cenocepacia TaxID=95486 RepID=UPI002AB5EB94|nr:SIR2 family protein [Burkholderia cenocepacia]
MSSPATTEPIPAQLPENYSGQLAYQRPGDERWLPQSESAFKVIHGVDSLDQQAVDRLASNRQILSDLLSGALQYTNLGFFAGSGTSLGAAGGPSMWQLWVAAMCRDSTGGELTPEAQQVCESIHYTERDRPNIEHFLSQCDAYLAFNADSVVEAFVVSVKKKILDLCTAFLKSERSDISAYRYLLKKLARRRVRDPRLKVFTTNYDMCFETAASDLGMMVVDGFSYTRRRRFDARHFSYDVVRRDADHHDFVEGVFHLHKLHGSVSWERSNNEVFEAENPAAEKACLIYPAKGKYQQAFLQPHLELLSRFLDFLRQPNTCLVTAGFGFNDDHLSEPIYSAIQANPSLKLVLTDHRCIEHVHNNGHHGSSPYWGRFAELARRGFDIHFIGGPFSEVVDRIPSLRAVSPAEQLADAVRRIGGRS